MVPTVVVPVAGVFLVVIVLLLLVVMAVVLLLWLLLLMVLTAVVVVGGSWWLTLEVGVSRVIERLPLGRIDLVPVVPLHFLGFFFFSIDYFSFISPVAGFPQFPSRFLGVCALERAMTTGASRFPGQD